MSSAMEKAQQFCNEEHAFRLGELPTESFHPKTMNLSQVADENLAEGIRLLQSVDDDIPPVAEKVLNSDVFGEMVDCFLRTIQDGRRIIFTGCGATGRLSILLEAAWRRFWRRLKREHPDILSRVADREDIAFSVMAGGDFALIKSVEGFEDFTDFGRHQLECVGVSAGDMVVAITEGGETSFVIGTAWRGLDAGAEVFFVYNNPTDALCRHVERSRQVIEESRIRKLDLYTGPMAISGSTRMQATTMELLIVGAALEIALTGYLRQHLSGSELIALDIETRQAADYHGMFAGLLSELSTDAAVELIADLTRLEERIYGRHGLVTYFADEYMLDVLTDTTERAPTFMLPPFRPQGDEISPRSWSFAKNPLYGTKEAWHEMLCRTPRGLDWDKQVYAQLKAPASVQAAPPSLDNHEIYRFGIGNEKDPSRTDTADSALIAVAVGDEQKVISAAIEGYGRPFAETAAICLGGTTGNGSVGRSFNFTCTVNDSPLKLMPHLAVKLILNTLSTITMTRMGRVIGNAMVWVSPSNKKLIDRGCRLIVRTTGCTYEHACVELYKAIEQVQSEAKKGLEVASPVAAAIKTISSQNNN